MLQTAKCRLRGRYAGYWHCFFLSKAHANPIRPSVERQRYNAQFLSSGPTSLLHHFLGFNKIKSFKLIPYICSGSVRSGMNEVPYRYVPVQYWYPKKVGCFEIARHTGTCSCHTIHIYLYVRTQRLLAVRAVLLRSTFRTCTS